MTHNPFATSPYTLATLSALTHLSEDEVEGLISHEASTYYHSDEDTHVGWLPSLQRAFHITEELAPVLEDRVNVGVTELTTLLDETVFVISALNSKTPTSSVFYTNLWAETVEANYGVAIGSSNFLVLLPANPHRSTYCGHADVILRLADRASHYTIAPTEALLASGAARYKKEVGE